MPDLRQRKNVDPTRQYCKWAVIFGPRCRSEELFPLRRFVEGVLPLCQRDPAVPILVHPSERTTIEFKTGREPCLLIRRCTQIAPERRPRQVRT